MMRRGIGSLQVRIGGLGNRASTDPRSESAVEGGIRGVDDCVRSRLPFFAAAWVCCLLYSLLCLA